MNPITITPAPRILQDCDGFPYGIVDENGNGMTTQLTEEW